MSAAASCAPPISLSNAGLNAWKFVRSPRQCSTPVPDKPRSVCVVIGPFIGWNASAPLPSVMRCAPPRSMFIVCVIRNSPAGLPRSHARLSIEPLMWHAAHDT